MNDLIDGHKIYEKAFYLSGNDTMTLRHYCTRAYIDSCFDEFNHLTIDDKLFNLGFAVARGLDLYTEIKKDIDKHVGYANYKAFSVFYIDYLRETEISLTEILPEHNDILFPD